ncbi:MAG: sensor histidine kinase [Gammaproteobacteria bacterium]|nr:sensor histidine kinase [Gammaproteobacteria bacterium]
MKASAIAIPRAARDGSDGFLPDFCNIRIVFIIVVAAELLAFILALTAPGAGAERWSRLGLLSLFIQWVSLSCAGVLCLVRARLARLPGPLAGTAAYLIILSLTVLAVECARFLARDTVLESFLPAGRHEEFLHTSLAIAAIVGAVMLRYFYVQRQTRRTIEAEARARLQALQARIRPHFMFNSMNTIASLTRTDPALAEVVVEDLAELFRVSLADAGALTTLGDELALIRRYLRIEALRMGERLRVEEETAGLPADAGIPALLIQPLVENAVYHGIEPRPEGGVIRIEGRCSDGIITLCVSNPLTDAPARRRGGNRMALDNIRERLQLHYGRQGRIEVGPVEGRFRARLDFPYQKREP